MYKYEKVITKLDDVLEGFTALKFQEPLSREEFENLTGVEIKDKDWNDKTAWSSNEYGTEDFKFTIGTLDQNKEEIYLTITLEIDKDKITHIVDLDSN